MSVRQTESRLPSGIKASDLGETPSELSNDKNYVLVSFLSSPITVGSTNHYVVFALNNSPADSYHWTFYSIPSEKQEQSDPNPTIGIYKYIPKKAGKLRVRVQIMVSGAQHAELILEQEIKEEDSNLKVLISHSTAALGGNLGSSRELINDFKRYILDAVQVDRLEIPEAILAAIVYSESIKYSESSLLDYLPFYERETRFDALERAANYLNQGNANSFKSDYHTKLGVCQLTPCQAAMVTPIPLSVPSPISEDPCIPLVNMLANRRVEDVNRGLEQSFDILEKDPRIRDFIALKIDIFNLLRFPKTNIKLCAKYFLKLKNRLNRWPALDRNGFLDDQTAIQVVASEFKRFPDESPPPTKPPTKGQAVATKEGKIIFGFLNHPVIYSNFPYLQHIEKIKGQIVDKDSGSSISGARIDLYKAVIRIIDNKPLKCYREPDLKSPKLMFDGNEVVVNGNENRNVLEYRTNYPTAESDWVQIDTGFGWGWILARSKETRYTSHVFDERETVGQTDSDEDGDFVAWRNTNYLYKIRVFKENYFDGEGARIKAPAENLEISLEAAPDAVKESKIIDLLPNFDGYEYGGTCYPYDLPGAGITPYLNCAIKKNNCSTFTEALIVKAWQDNITDFTYDLLSHEKWMVSVDRLNKDTRMSTLDPVLDKGMGELLSLVEQGKVVNPNAEPKEWTLIQGWEYPPSDELIMSYGQLVKKWTVGHSFLIIDIHPETKRILTLESGFGFSLNGPGFRRLGKLGADDEWIRNRTPVKHWWNRANLQTWDNLKEMYPYRKMARLRVNDLSWVK